MKKSMKLLSILFIVVFLSGCAKYNFTMEVGKDKSVTIEIIDAIDKEYESYGSQETEAAAAEEKGFTKTDYEDEDWIGYKLTKKYENIDDISSTDPVSVELMDILNEEEEEPKVYFQMKKGLFKTTYIANFTIDMNSDDSDTSDTETEDDDEDSSYDLSYKVILPVKAKTSNATNTSEDGKTLNWTLKNGELNRVTYEFSMINTTMVIIVAAAAVIIIGGVGFIVLKGKKKPNAGGAMPNAIPMNNQPGMPAQPILPQDGQGFVNPGPQPNPIDPNPLGAVAPEQPMDNMFGQPTPEQNFMPTEGMPSLENQPPIVESQPTPAVDFGQPAAFPEVTLEAAPEVAPAEVAPVGFDNNTDTVVMPPVGETEMAVPAVEPAPMAEPVVAPEVTPVETPEMTVPTIDPNNNNVQ